jgi:dTDP-4-dehydrorhamnose reductase
VYQRYLEAQRSEIVRSASDKFGSPTYTADLAAKILEIVETEEYGLYHVTNSGSASRFDYLKCVIEAFELSTPIEPVDSGSFPRSAPNPDCETLANLNIEFLNLEPMRPWRDAIHAYVASLKKTLM